MCFINRIFKELLYKDRKKPATGFAANKKSYPDSQIQNFKEFYELGENIGPTAIRCSS